MERGTPGYELVDKTEDLIKSIGRKLGIQNPLAAQEAVIKENREGQDPDSAAVRAQENWIGPIVKDAATDILSQIAVGSALKGIPSSTVPKLPPRSNTDMIDVTPKPGVLPSGVKGGALTKTQYPRTQTKLKGGRTFIDSPSIGTYIVGPQDKGFAAWLARNPKGTLQQYTAALNVYNQLSNPNYDPILGEDELTESFKPQFQRRARTGDRTYYYDITDHRMLRVPGMNTPDQQARYKAWLTQSLINRYNRQLLDPSHPFIHFENQSFYDTQGMEWRLVRTDKSGRGPTQPYEPMPLNEIDSRKMKSKNSSPEDKALLTELLKLNVSDRNALERANPWLIQWNSDTSGQNYHEHMIGLDETEFWESGAGKALGYMNNDVYDIERGIGNVVFLRDPRFKIMKDNIAEYITPSSKTEIYPGLKRRTNNVKQFTSGPYKGLNAVIGYEASSKSNEFTDLVIHAYNPDPNINELHRVAVIPNYYSNVYAKDLSTGEPVISEDIANTFIRSYVDAVLEGNQPGIVALENIEQHMFEEYGIDVEIPAPGGLQQTPEYQDLGNLTEDLAGYTKPVDTDPLDLKTFKTTPKIQRDRDAYWKKQFLLWEKGKYTQLQINLDKLK
tara:strand:- start:211 stop:2055 length:1845 start_codon:yes stop_codon:yes gene_type:complete